MKGFSVGAYFLAVILFFSPQVLSQEQAPVRGEARRGALPAGMQELRELVRNYHEADSEAGKAEIRNAIRKTLEEGQFAGHAATIDRLNRLDGAAASAERDLRRLGEEALIANISSMRREIRDMLDETISARDAAVEARLERLLSPRGERARPEGR